MASERPGPTWQEDTVLAELARMHRVPTPGLSAHALVEGTGLRELDVDVALEGLCTAQPPLARVHNYTGGYVATTPGLLHDQQRRTAERNAA